MKWSIRYIMATPKECDQGTVGAHWAWATAIAVTVAIGAGVFCFQKFFNKNVEDKAPNGMQLPIPSLYDSFKKCQRGTCSAPSYADAMPSHKVLALHFAVADDGGCQETLQQHGITLHEVLGRGMFGMVYRGATSC